MSIARTNFTTGPSDSAAAQSVSARCVTDDVVPGEHAVLAGHFPGNPIVPAVLILDRVRRAYGAWRGPVSMTRIVKAKFVSVLRPNEAFTIELRDSAEKICRFICTKRNGERFALGEFMTGQETNGS